MMAADQQLLYMTVSETNRGGGSDDGDDADDGRKSNVNRARDTAIDFADVVRRRAFLPWRAIG